MPVAQEKKSEVPEENPEKNQKPLEIKASSSENLISQVYTGTAEKTYFRSPMVADSYKPPYNPDDLWQKNW